MGQPLRILLIDNQPQRAQAMQMLLNFLGEACHCVTADQWREVLNNPDEWLTVIIGDCGSAGKAEEICEYLTTPGMQLPILALAEVYPQLAHWSAHIVGTVEPSQKYIEFLDILHRCASIRESLPAPDRKGIALDMSRTLVGNSPSIQQLRRLIDQVIDTEATVLILGESGTGKELVARHLHNHSKRANYPFVAVNCGAIPGELLESELFGHEKGSFTGAITARQGRFEMAQGGTLFLDEIGDMPPAMQVKLLRVLQERTFERVGSNKSMDADVRIIAATHKNLEEAMKSNAFREDLYYRLNVFPIEIPPLREHIEDLPILINSLIMRLGKEGRGFVRFLPQTVEALCHYPWPGNIRELANLIEQLLILYPKGTIGVNELPKKFRTHTFSEIDKTPMLEPVFAAAEEEASLCAQFMGDTEVTGRAFDLKEHLTQLELHFIRKALADCGGVVAHAAEKLNMRRTTLVEKMRKYGLMSAKII